MVTSSPPIQGYCFNALFFPRLTVGALAFVEELSVRFYNLSISISVPLLHFKSILWETSRVIASGESSGMSPR